MTIEEKRKLFRRLKEYGMVDRNGDKTGWICIDVVVLEKVLEEFDLK